jgi:hypothetical protein
MDSAAMSEKGNMQYSSLALDGKYSKRVTKLGKRWARDYQEITLRDWDQGSYRHLAVVITDQMTTEDDSDDHIVRPGHSLP